MNSKRIIGIVIGIIIILIGVAFATRNPQSSSTDSRETVPVIPATNDQATTTTPIKATSTPVKPPPKPTPKPETPGMNTPNPITMAEIAQHNTSQSCYSAINGRVYNLTAWITKHPGGSARILKICGKDGSSAFNAEHGGESKPEAILSEYFIGVLKQ